MENESTIDNEYKYTDEKKAHLHTYLGKPLLGTSTVVGIIAKPLTWWASGLAVAKLGWTNSKIKVDGKYTTIDIKTRLEALQPQYEAIKDMSSDQFLTLLDEAYKAHSVKLTDSADTGTFMHEMMEAYVTKCIDRNNGEPLAEQTEIKKLENFINWALLNVKKFMYSEKNVYSDRLWTGGIFDLMFEDKNGKICIGDFKSSKECYDSQFIQIAGYDLQQSENGIFNSGGYKMGESQKVEAYYVFPFGADKFEVGVRYNVEELRSGFESCCVLYKITNK